MYVLHISISIYVSMYWLLIHLCTYISIHIHMYMNRRLKQALLDPPPQRFALLCFASLRLASESGPMLYPWKLFRGAILTNISGATERVNSRVALGLMDGGRRKRQLGVPLLLCLPLGI